jgi:hypothetical protein
LKLEEILQRGVEAGKFQDQTDEPEEAVVEVKETKHQREVHTYEDESDSMWAKVKGFFGFGSAKSEQESSGGSGSGNHKETFSGPASDKTLRREGEDLPDEPNPRDL